MKCLTGHFVLEFGLKVVQFISTFNHDDFKDVVNILTGMTIGGFIIEHLLNPNTRDTYAFCRTLRFIIRLIITICRTIPDTDKIECLGPD